MPGNLGRVLIGIERLEHIDEATEIQLLQTGEESLSIHLRILAQRNSSEMHFGTIPELQGAALVRADQNDALYVHAEYRIDDFGKGITSAGLSGKQKIGRFGNDPEVVAANGLECLLR